MAPADGSPASRRAAAVAEAPRLALVHLATTYLHALPALLLAPTRALGAVVGGAALGLVVAAGWLASPGRVRPLWIALVGLHGLAAGLDALVVLLFGHRIRPEILFVVFETNLREAAEFVQMYADRRLALALALLAVPALAVAALRGRATPWWRGYAAALLALGLLGASQWSPAASIPPAWRFVEAAWRYRAETAAYHRLEASLARRTLEREVPPAPADELHVLVVGESTGRNHMGLYGYPRDTTPRLAALRDQLLVFTDVISHHSHTQVVMKELLTFMNQEGAEPWYQHPTLLDAMAAGGYRSFWVSNQEMYGLWSNVTSALASQADVRLFHKHRSGADTEGSQVWGASAYDGELLPYLDRILAAPARRGRFVVLHLMGTHGWYPNRFPPGTAVFEGQVGEVAGRDFLNPMKWKAINAYDDAVRYGDGVLAEVLARVAAAGLRSTVLFVSDHGEEVYDARDFLGHSERVGNRFMIEVPMLLWLSPEYRAAFPGRAAAAAAAVDLPFMTDDLPHVVLDLAGVEHPTFEATRSVVNPAYDASRPRRYAGRDYDCELGAVPRCPPQDATR